jgi:acyl carrier protein
VTLSGPIAMASAATPDDPIASIEPVVRAALATIRPDKAGLPGGADLAQEADLDSVEVMDLVMEIEDRLDLSIPVETMAGARTIDELCAGIARLRGGRG